MEELPKAYDPKLVEEKLYAFWEKHGWFKADASSTKPPFCIVIPPPNVTGVLHMGHALVGTIQDILIRWKRMLGFETLWVPGTDHAGISTQSIVEKNLYVKTGKRRSEFSREEFLKHVWDWKEFSEHQILSQLKKLGCSCDWSRLRFTMDEGNNQAVRTVFKKMFDDGLIYQGDYLVNWDPVTQTALSDDEVEHEERASFLWHIRYPLENGEEFIHIATTRPETMLGDVALAVHPSDPRYAKWIGRMVKIPLTSRLIPVIADHYVDPAFGTGVVKITPAHDFNDFDVGSRHHLPLINILTPDGKLNEMGGVYQGLDVEEARIQIVHALKSGGFLEKVDPHILRVGLSYRSKAVVQPYLSKQWFIRMAPFKEKLISAVKDKRVKLIPPHWEQTYFHWIEHLRDWCISRQLWWGHRIPIWHGPNGEMICSEEETPPPEALKKPHDWVQDPDVLDTWFSSALWPFAALGWPLEMKTLNKFYPTSTLITGHDILFFWVARMILMGEYVQDAPPFHETFLHGLIYGKSYWKKNSDGSTTYIMGKEKEGYDAGEPLPLNVESKWEKMSKTKGNIIDPIQVIATYGTDALRITLCSSATQARQIDLDQRRFEEYKNFANKIWNGSRFVLSHLNDLTASVFAEGLDASLFGLEDEWILSCLHQITEQMNQAFEAYAFDQAAHHIYEFFWNDFCSNYVEMIKPVLFGKRGTPLQKINKQKLLAIVLLQVIRLLHPITPFITEEIFSLLKAHFDVAEKTNSSCPYTKEALSALKSAACMVAPYPKTASANPIRETVLEDFKTISEIVRMIRNIRTEMQIPPSEKTDVYLIGSSHLQEKKTAENHQEILLSLTGTSRLIFHEHEPALFGSSALFKEIKILIPVPESMKEKERKRLEKEKEKLEKAKMIGQEKLNNTDFKAKAPQKIIDTLEQNVKELSLQLEELEKKIHNLHG
jgi:valyl-tRNA synthetase